MKKILLSIAAIFIGFALTATPVYAECVRTSVLGNSVCDKDGNKVDGAKIDGENYFSCSCDNGSGSSVLDILNLVVNIMSVGIGILGVIGITVVGIQYLTAADNEEQTRKAKRRLFEIIIGLVVYVIIYALLQWLMPKN